MLQVSLSGNSLVEKLQTTLKRLSTLANDSTLDPGQANGDYNCKTATAVAHLTPYIKKYLPDKVPKEIIYIVENSHIPICIYEKGETIIETGKQIIDWGSDLFGPLGQGQDAANATAAKSDAGANAGVLDQIVQTVIQKMQAGGEIPNPGSATNLIPKPSWAEASEGLVTGRGGVPIVYDPTTAGMSFLSWINAKIRGYPYAITAMTKKGTWRVAVAKKKSGLGQPTVDSSADHEEIAETSGKPSSPNLITLTLKEYIKLAGKWYEKPIVWAVIGGAVLATGGVTYYFVRK